MEKLTDSIHRFYRLASDALALHVAYSDSKIMLFGTFGIVAFPLYGWIWTAVYPQPFESMGLRLLMSAICAIVAFYRWWPQRLKRYWEPFWWCVALMTLPFFFTYMLLMNQFTPVWGMSLLAASIILVQLVDWRNYLVLHLIGGLLAYLLYALTVNSMEIVVMEQHDGLGAYFAVFVFAIGTGVLFNLTEAGYNRERNRATVDTGQRIAHELRTALQGVHMNAKSTRQLLPGLIDGYRQARDAGLIEDLPIRDSRLRQLRSQVDDIAGECIHGLDSISLLLANAEPQVASLSQSEQISVQSVVEEAVARRNRTPQVASWIDVRVDGDFSVRLPRVALRHILDNLFNNAIRAIYAAKRGEAGRLEIVVDGRQRHLIVTDNGCGIDPVILPMIFNKFFSTYVGNEGTGLGLYYCKSVVEFAGGEIDCRSGAGHGSSFTLRFPDIASQTDRLLVSQSTG